MGAPISPSELAAVESSLDVTFPDDYRRFLEHEDGVEDFFGDVYLALWSARDLVEFNAAYDRSNFPGLVLIGSDGGGEGVGLDFRQQEPAVVLVNFVSDGWHEALPQAATFDEFMQQRRRGEPLKFKT